ncbi:MAG: hypothetical protein R6U85_11055 [Salinivirgaceae bacterium]
MKTIQRALRKLSLLFLIATLATMQAFAQNTTNESKESKAAVESATVHYLGYVVIDVEYTISGTDITERGLVYSTSNSTPTVNGSNCSHIPITSTAEGTFIQRIDNLTEGTTYYFRAYVKSGPYSSYSPNILEEKTGVQSPEPPNAVSSFTVDPDVNSVSFNVVTVDAGFYVFHGIEGSTAPPTPLDDAPYGIRPSEHYNNPPESLAGQYNISMTGLTADTEYTFVVYPGKVNTFDTRSNIKSDGAPSVTFTTLKAAPTTQASGISITDVTSTSFTINWTNGNGDGRAVFTNTSPTFTDPERKVDPVANTTLSTSQSCVFNGTGTETSVTVTGRDEIEHYYIRVYEYSNTGTPIYNYDVSTANEADVEALTAQWNGTGTDWTTNGNWYAGTAPTTSQKVIIPNVSSLTPPQISTTETIGELIIEQGGELTVTSTGSLSVGGDLTIEGNTNGSGSLVVENSGNLSVSGTSTFNRYIPTTTGWHLISNPTSNSDIMQLLGYYANSWNESGPSWTHLDGSSSLTVMNGYSIKNTGSGAQTLSFSGNFNDGSQSITVTNANPSDGTETWGWNLVGNPYPSAIDWDAASGWTRTNINTSAYLYNGSGYDTYDWDQNIGPSPYIPAFQGFFIYAESSTTLGVTNNVRVNNSQSFYKESQNNPTPQIELQISNEVNSNRSYISFFEGATDNYDPIIDGPKLFGSAENLSQIYTLSKDNKILAVNTYARETIEEEEFRHEVALGYKTNVATMLTISMEKCLAINDSINVLLVDNYYYDTINLRTSTYEFESEEGTIDDRFSIIFEKITNPNTINTIKNPGFYAYTNNGELHVNLNAPLKNGQIIVYDIYGRPIINKSLTSKTKYILELPQKTNIFVVGVLTDKTILYRKTLVNKR